LKLKKSKSVFYIGEKYTQTGTLLKSFIFSFHIQMYYSQYFSSA